MFLTVTTTHEPATDLGYLLHKHPDRVQQFRQSFGSATVFYPEATSARCTAALLLEVDPALLAKLGRSTPDFSLAQYVNDRSYAASSLLAVALGDVFGTARSGRCTARQELADSAIPLRIEIPVLPCRGGPTIARRIFEPLGWQTRADPIPLDDRFPDWGDSRYVHLVLTGTMRLADALNQLYVLLPVMDTSKHYWQGPDEVDKLLRSGGGWLATHPERAEITRRYLGRRSWLTAIALARLAELGDETEQSMDPPADEEPAETGNHPAPLAQQRHRAVMAALTTHQATSVIDLGCGNGRFLEVLLADQALTKVAGVDVSLRSLHFAGRRLHLDTISERQAARIELFQGALTYEDPRFAGYDAAVLMEVIEHIDPPRLGAVEHVIFGAARPRVVVVTTPNADYNVNYPDPVGKRHPDHRFEWTRAEFEAWAGRVAAENGYVLDITGIGEQSTEHGSPTQMAVFHRD